MGNATSTSSCFERRVALAGVPLAALLLSACVATPELGPRPQMRAPQSIAAERSLPATPGASWPAQDWWRSFGDPQLAALIDEGLRNSPDISVATARLRKASAVVGESRAATLPTLDAEGKLYEQRQSLNNGFPDAFKQFLPHGWKTGGEVAGSFSFDLDLWGKNRAALAAATSEERAAAVDVEQARLMLSTAIAAAYFDLARLFRERDVRQAALDARTATQKLVGNRVVNGLDTQGSLHQAEAEVATARADLNDSDRSIAVRRHQIAALVGAGPDRGLDIATPTLTQPEPEQLPPGVTTDLVGRRPDIVSARERVEAAASRIKVAHADFFPAIRLSALIGVQSLGLSKLFETDSLFGNAGPALSLPIFHGGELRGRYREARATYDEAVADYDKTVLGAYQQVADAVTSRRLVGQGLANARDALTASEQAYKIARLRYEGGLSNYLDVLEVEDRLLQARLVVAALDAQARTLDIDLIRALGGGFAGDAETLIKEKPNG
jgi:NodT family efflux transporter outer membrane factor (OMF) lipoprotein